jgi:lysophospholipase L1-like esterase
MKKVHLFVLAALVTANALAQTPAWDSTFRPNNYAIRVGQFRSYADSKNDIIFLGNSITAGTDWNELLGITNGKNRGISGDITFGILERLDEITEGKPKKVFLLIGINDIQRNIPDSLIAENYLRIVSRIKAASPSTRIYLQTLLPVNNEFTQFKNHYNKDEHIQAANEALKRIAKSERLTLIDLHPHFLGKDKKLDKQYTMDGLHLNAAGYRRWAGILRKYVME